MNTPQHIMRKMRQKEIERNNKQKLLRIADEKMLEQGFVFKNTTLMDRLSIAMRSDSLCEVGNMSPEQQIEYFDKNKQQFKLFSEVPPYLKDMFFICNTL